MTGGGAHFPTSDDYREAFEEVAQPYECLVCGEGSDPDDHKRETLNWCSCCDGITYHERRD